MTVLCGVSTAHARSKAGKDYELHVRQANEDRVEDEARIRMICAKMLHDTGLLKPSGTTES